jgi:transposase
VVGADETRLRIVRDKSGKTKNGFVWTFNARDDDGGLDIAYVFAEDRSGSTPKMLLEGTKGVLLVDGYSGYNVVDEVSTRRRAACHAHLRRYFHEALPTASVAQEMLDLVAELYIAEHAADERALVGRAKLEFRKERAGPIRARMRTWLDAHRERHPPKSPIGGAIRYADNQWKQLGVFLSDEHVPLDNNGSERALRRVALGRKNYLFVHDVECGANIAGLYSLVATCEARQINPFEYLTDVLARVQDHPARDIDALLPAAWIDARNDG